MAKLDNNVKDSSPPVNKIVVNKLVVFSYILTLTKDKFTSFASSLTNSTFIIEITDGEVLTSEGFYNEANLAFLENFMDSLTSYNVKVIINYQSIQLDSTNYNTYIDRLYHITRRVKSCPAVIGVILSSNLLEFSSNFQEGKAPALTLITKLTKKHPAYTYFIRGEEKDFLINNPLFSMLYSAASGKLSFIFIPNSLS